MIALLPCPLLPLVRDSLLLPSDGHQSLAIGGVSRRGRLACADDPEDSDDELGDEEDLTAQPSVDEESAFDDFDDDFDDDFEEEENDPDWDHPEENEPPPPGKGPSKRK